MAFKTVQKKPGRSVRLKQKSRKKKSPGGIQIRYSGGMRSPRESAALEHQAIQIAGAYRHGREISSLPISRTDAASFLLPASPARPLPYSLEQDLAQKFSADVSKIRIHVDPMAHAAARENNAKAFTAGSDIFFAEGLYRPDTHEGRERIAHEVVHALQQTGRENADGYLSITNARGHAQLQRDPADGNDGGEAVEEAKPPTPEEAAAAEEDRIRNVVNTEFFLQELIDLHFAGIDPDDHEPIQGFRDRIKKPWLDGKSNSDEVLTIVAQEVVDGEFDDADPELKGVLFDMLKFNGQEDTAIAAIAMLDRDHTILTKLPSPQFSKTMFDRKGFGWITPLIKGSTADKKLKEYFPGRYLQIFWVYLTVPNVGRQALDDFPVQFEQHKKDQLDFNKLSINERLFNAWSLLGEFYAVTDTWIMNQSKTYSSLNPSEKKQTIAANAVAWTQGIRETVLREDLQPFFDVVSNDLQETAEKADAFWKEALTVDLEFLKTIDNPFVKKKGEFNYEETILERASGLLTVKEITKPKDGSSKEEDKDKGPEGDFSLPNLRILNPGEYQTQLKLFNATLDELIRKVNWKLRNTFTRRLSKEVDNRNLALALAKLLDDLYRLREVLNIYNEDDDNNQSGLYDSEDVRQHHRLKLADFLWRMGATFGWEYLTLVMQGISFGQDTAEPTLALKDDWKVDDVPVSQLAVDFGYDRPLAGYEPFTAGHIVQFFALSFYLMLIEKVNDAIGTQEASAPDTGKKLVEDLNAVVTLVEDLREKMEAGEEFSEEELQKKIGDKAIGRIKPIFDAINSRIKPVRMIFPNAEFTLNVYQSSFIDLIGNHDKVKKMLTDSEMFKDIKIDINDFFPLYPAEIPDVPYIWLVPSKDVLFDEIAKAIDMPDLKHGIAKGAASFTTDASAGTLTVGDLTIKKGDSRNYFRETYEFVEIPESYTFSPDFSTPGPASAVDEGSSKESVGEKPAEKESFGTITPAGDKVFKEDTLLLKVKRYTKRAKEDSDDPSEIETRVDELNFFPGNLRAFFDLSTVLEYLSFEPIVKKIEDKLDEVTRLKQAEASDALMRANRYQRIYTAALRIIPKLERFSPGDVETMMEPIDAIPVIEDFRRLVKPEPYLDVKKDADEDIYDETEPPRFVLHTQFEHDAQMAALMLELADLLHAKLIDTTRYDIVTGYSKLIYPVVDFLSEVDVKDLLPYLDVSAAEIDISDDEDEAKAPHSFVDRDINELWITVRHGKLKELRKRFDEVGSTVQAKFGFEAKQEGEADGWVQSTLYHSKFRISQEDDFEAGAEVDPDAEISVEEGILHVPQVQGEFRIKKIHRTFTYHPDYGTEGTPGYQEPKVLDSNGDEITERLPLIDVLPKNATKPVTLYVPVQDDSNPNYATDNYLLEQFSKDLDNRSFSQSMANLGKIIEVYMDLLLEVASFMPGVAPAAIMAQILMQVDKAFLAEDSPYEIMKKFLAEGLTEKFDEIRDAFSPDNILIFTLFGNPWLEKFLSTGGQEKESRIAKGNVSKKSTAQKLKAMAVKIGKMLRELLEELNDSIQDPVVMLQDFSSTRPLVAFVIDLAAELIERLPELQAALEGESDFVEQLKNPGKFIDDQMRDMQTRFEKFTESLEEFELPKEKIVDFTPLLSGIVQGIIHWVAKKAVVEAAKGAKSQKKVIVGSAIGAAVVLMETTGVNKLIADKAAAEILDLIGDPNDIWAKDIAPSIEGDFESGRKQLVEILSGISQAFREVRAKFKGVASSSTSAPGPSAESANSDAGQPDSPSNEPFKEPFSLTNSPNESDQDSDIDHTQSRGERLPVPLRANVEERFGHDFGHVRIHRDATAHEMTESSGAEALTSGSHIYLNSSNDLNNSNTWDIIDHEMVHVLQQTGHRPLNRKHSQNPVESVETGGLQWDLTREAEATRFANIVRNRDIAEEPVKVSQSKDEGFAPSSIDLLTVHRILKHVNDPEKLKRRQVFVDSMTGETKPPPGAVNVLVNDIHELLNNINLKKNATRVTWSKILNKDRIQGLVQSRLRTFTKLSTDSTSSSGASSSGSSGSTEMMNALRRLAKAKIKKKDKSKEKEFEQKEFLRSAEGYILSKTGIAVSIDASKNVAPALAGQLEKIGVLHVHLPNVHGGTGLWTDVIRTTWFRNSDSKTMKPDLEDFGNFEVKVADEASQEEKDAADATNKMRKKTYDELADKERDKFTPQVRAKTSVYLSSRSLSPIILTTVGSGKDARLKFRDKTKLAVERLMIEPAGGTLHPDELPALEDYIDTGIDPYKTGSKAKKGLTANRLDLNTHAAQKKMKSTERESHHLTQYLLAEYFSNKSKDKKPFPESWDPPGVTKSGNVVTEFDAEGKKKLDLAGLEDKRGGIMPAILLAAPTHRGADLHVTREPDDIDGETKKVQSHFVNNAFFGSGMSTELATALKAPTGKELMEMKRDPASGMPRKTDNDITDGIHKAIMTTYGKMSDHMMTQLKNNMPAKEADYFVSLYNLKNPTSPMSDSQEVDLIDKFSTVARKAETYNEREMEKLGWKK
jgi:hypothetical protein